MRKSEILMEYYEWLLDIIGVDKGGEYDNYRLLLKELHAIEFYVLPNISKSVRNDINRAKDGEELRSEFASEYYDGKYGDRGYSTIIDILNSHPCSMLEMMVALARRYEEDFMSDPRYGDRTTFWFWEMIRNLGLDVCTDEHFDSIYVDDIIRNVLDRKYRRNGKGGLFYIPNTTKDLRKVELWYQMCWYMNGIG